MNELREIAIRPVEIRRKIETLPQGEERGIGIYIKWSSGAESFLPAKTLREHCPCATCREKEGTLNHDRPLSTPRKLLRVVSATLEEETDIEELWPVGNYALGIRWGDKHDSGIYSFELLRQLEKPEGG